VCAIPDAGGIPIKKITKAPAFLELIQWWWDTCSKQMGNKIKAISKRTGWNNTMYKGKGHSKCKSLWWEYPCSAGDRDICSVAGVKRQGQNVGRCDHRYRVTHDQSRLWMIGSHWEDTSFYSKWYRSRWRVFKTWLTFTKMAHLPLSIVVRKYHKEIRVGIFRVYR
jgi:hypothetical protein